MVTQSAEMLRTCKECGATHALSLFPRYSNDRGYRAKCRECVRKDWARYRRTRRANDPEMVIKDAFRAKEYREKYSEGYRQHKLKKRAKHQTSYFTDLRYRCNALARATQSRARNKGVACEVTGDILFVLMHVQNHKCAVTGTKFNLGAHSVYFRNPNAPSIDRKNSDGGYTLDNIQVVAAWYNLMKNEWSDVDVRSFIHTAYHTLFEGE